MFPKSGIIYKRPGLSPKLTTSNNDKPRQHSKNQTDVITQSKSTQIRNDHTSCQQPSFQSVSQKIPNRQYRQLVGIRQIAGFAMIVLAMLGVTFPLIPKARLETSYARQQIEKAVSELKPTVALPPSVPIVYTPLLGPDGKEITPVNTEFSIVIPKLGINAEIIPSVDPLNPKEYNEALHRGVAHAKTSYFPNQNGATYLFSHSTNYQWFVKDLNAIFYNVKNLSDGDIIIIFHKGKRYTYQYTSREIVAPKNISYLLPVTGKRQLILQTCWPPGTYYQRLLIFADFVEEEGRET